MTRPLVGVSTYYTEATFSSWTEPAAVVPNGYFELVTRAGGTPLLLPPSHELEPTPGAVRELLGHLDALVLIGGGDVDPSLYGQAVHPKTAGVDDRRDRAEVALAQGALDADLPLLAICRGHQVLNVVLGGTLHQHVPDVIGSDGHRERPGTYAEVTIRTEPATVAQKVFTDTTTVMCSHHQCIDRLGDGLVASGYSVEPAGTPGIIEAIEHPGQRFVLGVQWHPEAGDDVRPFAALIAATGAA